MNPGYAFEGGCTCRRVRYRMLDRPLIVHSCHCTWCQRETGTAFATNALIEAERVEILTSPPKMIHTPSNSGKGQKIHRCPECHVAVWSNYAGSGDKFNFVRVGTLDHPAAMPPDIHIFTSTKQPSLVLPADVPAFAEFYNIKEMWPAESLARRKAISG